MGRSGTGEGRAELEEEKDGRSAIGGERGLDLGARDGPGPEGGDKGGIKRESRRRHRSEHYQKRSRTIESDSEG